MFNKWQALPDNLKKAKSKRNALVNRINAIFERRKRGIMEVFMGEHFEALGD